MRLRLLALTLASCTFDAGFVGGDGAAPPDGRDDAGATGDDGGDDGGSDGGGGPFCDPADPDLVLCLEFEGDVSDHSPEVWALEWSGVTFVEGPPGGGMAARLDLGSFIRINDGAGWTPSSEITWEVSMRPDFIPGSSMGRFGILDKDGEWSSFLSRDGVSCSAYGVGMLVAGASANTWSRVRCVYQATGISAYVNDVYQGAQVLSTVTVDGEMPLHIGQNSPNGNEEWRGALDGIRVWKAARAP